MDALYFSQHNYFSLYRTSQFLITRDCTLARNNIGLICNCKSKISFFQTSVLLCISPCQQQNRSSMKFYLNGHYKYQSQTFRFPNLPNRIRLFCSLWIWSLLILILFEINYIHHFIWKLLIVFQTYVVGRGLIGYLYDKMLTWKVFIFILKCDRSRLRSLKIVWIVLV